MTELKIFDLLNRRVLITRGSARAIESELGKALAEGHGEITLDFFGIDGLAPSFLDETLSMIEQHIQEANGSELRVIIANSPTQLSSKFSAVGRGHELDIKELDEHTWVISRIIRSRMV